MQCLEVTGAVRLIYRPLGVKGLITDAGLQLQIVHKIRFNTIIVQTTCRPASCL